MKTTSFLVEIEKRVYMMYAKWKQNIIMFFKTDEIYVAKKYPQKKTFAKCFYSLSSMKNHITYIWIQFKIFFITPIKTMWLNAAATDDDEVPEMMRFLMRFSRARFFCSKLFKHAVKISNILHTHYTLTNKIFHKNSCIWCWVLKFEILEVLRTNNAWDEWSRGDQQTDSKSL